MEGLLGLRESLSTLTSRKFLEAYKNKDIIFSDTSLAIVKTQKGIPVGPSPAVSYNPWSFLSNMCPVPASILPSFSKEADAQATRKFVRHRQNRDGRLENEKGQIQPIRQPCAGASHHPSP